MKRIVVIGGGLAGLISAILLVRKGFSVILFEEKSYPFHRVCGEYISNEVIPFLKRNDLYPEGLNPTSISQLHLTSPSGISLNIPLDLGGFGLSRYAFDNWLYRKALEEGVEFHHCRVIKCAFEQDTFNLQTRNGQKFTTDIVIGAFGKKSILDKNLDRTFTYKRYPYIGVKYHINSDEAEHDTIALHNFRDGYCGISRVEGDKFNVCYLTERQNLRKYGSISVMEEEVLFKNSYLKKIFETADFLFPKPEVINEISFFPKEPVHEHILMAGDSAGMIAPLCGNGMAIAIHAAMILSELIQLNIKNGFDRQKLEESYRIAWNATFRKRLQNARNIQHLFGATYLTELAVLLNKAIPSLASILMKKTHGLEF
ncbi:MAG: NAD(P)/FAD-dependent oxidoreductase [Ekhidna sp.]|nr:NAD(P)/FAD-dependent oxidoreductase [Ekhidna sp.]